MTAQIIDKPWGREIILTTPDSPYAAKILEIKAGKRVSLQYHDQKLETLCLFSGECNIIWGPNQDELKTEAMQPLRGYTIPLILFIVFKLLPIVNSLKPLPQKLEPPIDFKMIVNVWWNGA